MKATIIYLLMSLLICFNNSYGQCLQNGNFSTACAGVILNQFGECPTWTNACGAGWTRSHGSPQMIPYTVIVHGVPVTYFYAFMWSTYDIIYNLMGEGMFTPYNFQANHSYDVKFRISTSQVPGPGNTGSVLFYAANGLSQSVLYGCADPVPNISQKQLITQYTGLTNGTIDVTATFTANSNYSQLWIYPAGTMYTYYQYNLGVFNAQVCPSCTGVITYNNGIVPSGETKAGTIFVGSSAGTGGSGTVTVQASQATNLVAADQIIFLPQFSATVTSGSFSAKIENCVSGIYKSELDTINIELIESDEGNNGGGDGKIAKGINIATEQEVNKKQFLLFPNPSKGEVFVQIDNKEVVFEIEIFDSNGRLIQKRKKINAAGAILVNLSGYKTGYYFIKVIGKNFTKVSKVLIE